MTAFPCEIIRSHIYMYSTSLLDAYLDQSVGSPSYGGGSPKSPRFAAGLYQDTSIASHLRTNSSSVPDSRYSTQNNNPRAPVRQPDPPPEPQPGTVQWQSGLRLHTYTRASSPMGIHRAAHIPSAQVQQSSPSKPQVLGIFRAIREANQLAPAQPRHPPRPVYTAPADETLAEVRNLAAEAALAAKLNKLTEDLDFQTYKQDLLQQLQQPESLFGTRPVSPDVSLEAQHSAPSIASWPTPRATHPKPLQHPGYRSHVHSRCVSPTHDIRPAAALDQYLHHQPIQRPCTAPGQWQQQFNSSSSTSRPPSRVHNLHEQQRQQGFGGGNSSSHPWLPSQPATWLESPSLISVLQTPIDSSAAAALSGLSHLEGLLCNQPLLPGQRHRVTTSAAQQLQQGPAANQHQQPPSGVYSIPQQQQQQISAHATTSSSTVAVLALQQSLQELRQMRHRLQQQQHPGPPPPAAAYTQSHHQQQQQQLQPVSRPQTAWTGGREQYGQAHRHYSPAAGTSRASPGVQYRGYSSIVYRPYTAAPAYSSTPARGPGNVTWGSLRHQQQQPQGRWLHSSQQQQQQQQVQQSSIWDDSAQEQQLYRRLAQRPASSAGAEQAWHASSSLRSKSAPRQRQQHSSSPGNCSAGGTFAAAAAGGGGGVGNGWRGVLGVGCSVWSRSERDTGGRTPGRRPATANATLGRRSQNAVNSSSGQGGPRAAAVAAQLAGLDVLRPAVARGGNGYERAADGASRGNQCYSTSSWLHSSPMKRLTSRGDGSSSGGLGGPGTSAAAVLERKYLSPSTAVHLQQRLRPSTGDHAGIPMVSKDSKPALGVFGGLGSLGGVGSAAGRGLFSSGLAISGADGPSEAALAAAAASLGLQSRFGNLSSRAIDGTRCMGEGSRQSRSPSKAAAFGVRLEGLARCNVVAAAVAGGGGAAAAAVGRGAGRAAGGDSPLTKQILAYAARRYSSPKVNSLLIVQQSRVDAQSSWGQNFAKACRALLDTMIRPHTCILRLRSRATTPKCVRPLLLINHGCLH